MEVYEYEEEEDESERGSVVNDVKAALAAGRKGAMAGRAGGHELLNCC